MDGFLHALGTVRSFDPCIACAGHMLDVEEGDRNRTSTLMTNVLGLGNILMGDDGFGPAVVRAYDAEHPDEPDVHVFDLGSPGLDLTPWLVDVERVTVVAPHDPGLKEALLTLEFAGRAPCEVTLIGAVPQAVRVSMHLSKPIRQAIPRAVAAIAAAVGHGV